MQEMVFSGGVGVNPWRYSSESLDSADEADIVILTFSGHVTHDTE